MSCLEESRIPPPRLVVMLNGQPPRRELLESVVAGAEVLIGADAGAMRLREAGLRVDYVVGDFDSVPEDLLRSLPAESVVHDPGQDDTDLEKALRLAVARWQQPDIVVLGTTGDRIDHVLGNICGAVRYTDGAFIRFVEDHSITYFAHRQLQFSAPVGATVSLLPLGEVEGVRTEGLRWALHGETLSIGTRGVSNVVERSPVRIEWQCGHLVVVRLLEAGELFEW
ncbi:MAG: thiamine diphosphokinase [Armatimonadota bacterium]|nr:thiamine diphosphokinase [bacterium]MDW8104988.1 thiamine diphosphokinase [Armatimonadota bacterium]MDW8290752.1 thiamine diphosphokinase [Armatimonadota bacterium]